MDNKFFDGDIRRLKDNPMNFAVYWKGKWRTYCVNGKIDEDFWVTEDKLKMVKTREDEIDFCNILKSYEKSD